MSTRENRSGYKSHISLMGLRANSEKCKGQWLSKTVDWAMKFSMACNCLLRSYWSKCKTRTEQPRRGRQVEKKLLGRLYFEDQKLVYL